MRTEPPTRAGPAVSDAAARDVRDLVRVFLGTGAGDPGWTPRSAPERLLEAAERLRVLPHVCSALERTEIPESWRGAAERLFAPAMQRHAGAAMFLRHHAAEALRRLGAAGIPVIPFKGSFLSADLYGDPLFRPGADVDILLVGGRADVAPACAALRGMGYVEPDAAPAVREYLLAEKGQLGLVGEGLPPLDLHYALYDDLPARAPADAAARAVAVEGEEPRRLTFSRVDLLMILAVHCWRHPGEGRMLPLVDLAVLCRDGSAFPGGWLDIVRSWRMALYVAAGIEAVRHEFGVVPAGAVRETLREALPRRAAALCDRIRRDGADGLPFGLVQRSHRLGLPWRERLRAVRRYLWPHPGKLAGEPGAGPRPPGPLARLVHAGRSLVRAIGLR